MKSSDVDVGVLWELLREQGGRHAVEDLAELAFGDRSEGACRAVEEAVRADRARFRERKGMFEPRSPESVQEALLQRRLEAERASRREAALAEVRLALSAARPADWDRIGEELAPLEELAVHGDATPFAVRERAEELLRDLGRTKRRPWVAAVRTLTAIGRLGRDENLLLRRHRIPLGFGDDVLAEADRIATGEDPVLDPRREDRTAALTVAIDDVETDEVDDALTAEPLPGGGWVVEVHISDASAWIPAGSVVDGEACRRGATLYLPDRRIPMVPPVLAFGGMSLVEGEDRAALTFRIELNAQGRVVDFSPRMTRIRVDHQLPYEEVDSLLDTRSDTALGTMLRALFRSSETLRRERIAAGAMEVQPPEVKVRIDDGGGVRISPIERFGPARRMVSEWMIQTGRLAAAWCRDRRAPAVFRCQEAPEELSVELPEESVVDAVMFHAIVRGLRKAQVTSQPGAHWGLGVEAYTQVTSPIRRYADLVMHRQIKSVLLEEDPALSDAEVLAAVAVAESAGDVLGRIERETTRYFTLEYLAARRGETLSVQAIAPRDRGRWLVNLEGLGMQSTVTLSGEPAVRDLRTVEIVAANAREDRLHLREVGQAAPGAESGG